MEHRTLGLDRRSAPYAAVAFGIIALWAWVMPWVNDQIAWDDPTRAGDAIQVTENVTMTVPPGWGVVSGVRTTDDTRSQQDATDSTLLIKDGVAFSILQGPFDRSPRTLLAGAERITGAANSGFHTSGEVENVTTATGLRGVTQAFTAPVGAGAVTAFVVDGRGIKIQVAGPRAQVAAAQEETDAMINSLAKDGDES